MRSKNNLFWQAQLLGPEKGEYWLLERTNYSTAMLKAASNLRGFFIYKETWEFFRIRWRFICYTIGKNLENVRF